MVRTVATDLRALPLVRGGVIPQERRAVADNWCRKVQRAWEGIAVASTKVPFRIKTAGTGEKFVVEETGRQSRDRGIDIHVIVVLMRNGSSKRVRWSRSPSREE